MPDENKLKRLATIGYVLKSTCGLCEHGRFVDGASFGKCMKFTYTHGKHTGPDRAVSIHRAGCCPSFASDSAWLTGLVASGFDRFVKGGA